MPVFMKPTGQLQLCGRDKIKHGHFTPLKRGEVKPWLKDQQEDQDVQVNQLVHESAYYQVHGQKGKQGQKRSTLEEKASSRGMSPMSTALYDPIKAMRNMTDETIVLFSGGKDSAVTLDLCFRYFKKVQPVFMYMVKGLSFQEKVIQWYEEKYGVEMIRVPHFELSDFLRYGTFRLDDLSVPIVNTADIYNYLRELTGIYWISGGERISDSIVRRAMIKESSSIGEKRGRFYPIAYWNKPQVMSYVKQHRLPLSLESRMLGFSFSSLEGKQLSLIKDIFPDDFEKIKSAFPLAEASIKMEEFYGHK